MKTDPVVIIVGAGVFGVSVANHLARENAKYQVKLINPSDYAYFLPSAVRLTVSADYEGSILPLQNLLDSNVDFIKDKVARFDRKEVRLESGPILSFDVLIVATGSNWPDPIGSSSIFADNYDSFFKSQLAKIEAASHITFIGGGYVNSEIAGELVAKYGDEIKAGKKKVSIIHSTERLLPSNGQYSDVLRDKVTKHLADSGVELILNCKGTISSDNPNRVILEGSKYDFIDADIIYEGVGINPNVPLNEIPDFCDDRGFVRVSRTFQTKAVEEGCIFAIGDVTNFQYHGLIKRDNWVSTMTKNVVRYLSGASSEELVLASTYESGHVPAAVSLGPRAGFGQIPVPFFGTISIPSFAVVQLKSKHLLKEKAESMYTK